MLSLRASSKQTFSFSIFLFYIHQFHVPSSFFFWCLVQSGLFLFLKLAFYAIAQLPSLADIAVCNPPWQSWYNWCKSVMWGVVPGSAELMFASLDLELSTDSSSLCQIYFQFLTLVDFVSPANCNQPETRAVGHPCNP